MSRPPDAGRCALCPGLHNVVPPCGPRKAEIMLVAEAPGVSENKALQPFVGKAGQELNEQYLPLAGLYRNDLRICNTVSCLPPGTGKLDPNQPKDAALIKCCAEFHLYREIAECQPKLIVPMGGVAGSLIPGLDLDMHWGFPYTWDVPSAGEYTIFPLYHPALALHSPKEGLKLRSGFIRLNRYLAGKLHIPQDKYPNPDYTVLNTVSELDAYILGPWASLDDGTLEIALEVDMALDTEVTRSGDPYCLTFSVWTGTARLILATNKEVLERFNWWCSQWLGWFILHNRPFDRPILMRMGVHLNPKRIIDTMQEAWHLGNLPQGLKVLAYRQLGVEMKSFDDLVRPHSTAKALEYLCAGLNVDWPKPVSSMTRDKDGIWKEYKPQTMNTKLKRFFTDLGKNPNMDVFDRWKNWKEEHGLIESILGKWPGKDITHVPLNEVTGYACEDAARTLELWPIQKRASRLVRRLPEHKWYDL